MLSENICKLTEVKLASQSVDAAHRENVAGHGGGHGDEGLEKDRAGDLIGAKISTRVWPRGHHELRDPTHGGGLPGVRAAELVEPVEQLGEPHHQTVVAAQKEWLLNSGRTTLANNGQLSCMIQYQLLNKRGLKTFFFIY